MNKVILMGRLTRDPEVRYSAGENSMAIARYTLAVDRRFKRDGEATADFIGCVAFGRQAEFAERYFRQGIRIVVTGRIQTGSYTNGMATRYTLQTWWWKSRNLRESKSVSDSHVGHASMGAPAQSAPSPSVASADGFMNIPDEIDEEVAI